MLDAGSSGDPIFDCPGEMAARYAAYDWSATPLGVPHAWPASLRTAVAMLLRSRFPMILSWGEDFVMLYNDAYIPTLGTKHPAALGSTLPVEFAEIWDAIGPMQREVLAGGEATFFEDLPLVIERGSGPEETFFTFSYSHVPAEAGPGGVLAVLAITTAKVVGARRLALLNEIGSLAPRATDPQQVVRASLRVLDGADDELVHGGVFAPGRTAALSLSGRFGTAPPSWPGATADDVPGPVSSCWRTETLVRDRVEVDGSTYDLVALPLRAGGRTAGVLLVVPNPLRPLDEEHLTFLELVADQLGQLLTAAALHQQQHERLAALDAIDTAKTEFLSNVSHEFRTPLTLILGPLEDSLSGRPGALSPERVAEMHQSAHRLLRMVNDILAVATLDAEGSSRQDEPTDVAALVSDLLQPFWSAAERAGLFLDVHLPEALEPVSTDPRHVETVVLNLVANAIKYTSHGSVRVDLEADDDHLVVRVGDTGPGIPDDQQDLVFERFHRVTGAETSGIEGTGLGLSLVVEALHALGGRIDLQSEVGVGSVFTVRVPRVAPEPEEEPLPAAHRVDLGAAEALARDVAPGPDAVREDGPGDGLRPTLLVVDDNAALRGRLARALEELGQVVTAADGLAALDVMRARHVDLVVTDVMMPRLDGVGLLREVRRDPALATTPVLVLSARAGSDAATGALDAGADDYVVKPFAHDELVARCRVNLELARLRDAAADAKARSVVLAGVSHDMQTPLAVITTTLDMIDDPAVDPELRGALAVRAHGRARQLDRLVRQFLDWSRLASGTPLVPVLQPVDLGALLAEVVSHHDVATLGEVPVGAVVTCDERRTERVLHNLLENAARVASRVDVRVEAVSDDEGRHRYCVAVTDDGPGVAADVRPHLFAAFGPTDRPTGNGLGLHVSREAALAQGGDLALAATGTTGSTFVLTFGPDDGRS